MVPPLGIEPSSRVLQTRAEMTTLAHPVFGGGWESRTPDFAVQGRRFPTSTNPPNLVVSVGFEPTGPVLAEPLS